MVTKAYSAGVMENYYPADEYWRRGKPDARPTPGPERPAATETPMEVYAVMNDTLSLHQGDDEQLSLPDVTLGGDIRASQDMSDVSNIDLDGESDAEDMLNTLAEAYDQAFPSQQLSTSDSQDTSASSSLFNGDSSTTTEQEASSS